MIKKIPKIGLTTGDPAGIGPDILIKLAQYEYDAELVVIGDPYLLEDRAKKLNLRLKLNTFSQQKEPIISKRGELSIEEVILKDKVVAGQLNVAHSDYVLKTLDKAISHCLIKKLDALVTGPINKHSINTFLKSKKRNNQINFTGHTEYLAEKCNCPDVVMMLTDESKGFEQSKSKEKALRVALATTHLPLKMVSEAINISSLEKTIRILNKELIETFNVNKPNIFICGLNPHAGENGDLGDEEKNIIEPCLKKLESSGMNLIGPLPADTIFTPKYLDKADAILAMYHDQGLPVIKSKCFGETVNITLGLPFTRVSVDHGTALELAGTGKANAKSLLSAVNLAIELTTKQNHEK